MLGLDLRTLGLFRFVLGSLTLIDLWNRAPDIEAFYTDFGVLPRATFITDFANENLLSFHLFGGTTFAMSLLFIVHAVIAFLLLIGWRTRLMTVLGWAFLISLHGRNPYVLQGGDILFRMLFFWGMFLPLGARWSVDAALALRQGHVANGPDPEHPHQIANVATAALILQACFVYWFTMTLKTGKEWWQDYSAVHYALHLDHFTTPLAEWLRTFPDMMRALTITTAWVEIIVPALAIVGGLWWPLRAGSIACMVGLHIIFGSALKIGLFPWISSTSWIVMLPGAFWDRLGLAQSIGGRFGRFVILAARLGRLPTRAPSVRLHPTLQVLCFGLLAYVFAWNVGTLNNPTTLTVGDSQVTLHPPKMPKPLQRIGYTLRLDQKWDMFAPRPMRGDGWFVMPATLSDGSTIDLFREGAAVSWAKPKRVSSMYPSQRWRKYLMNIWMAQFKKHRRHFGAYLCRLWERDLPDSVHIKSLHVLYMKEETLADGPAPVECRSLWNHWCQGEAKNAPRPEYMTQCDDITRAAKAERAAAKKAQLALAPAAPP